ncbi:hypothetical protein BH11MYX3_BH11MYX3_47390 [soil metagenome]
MIGATVGSYRITDQISVGGMGTVFRAEHTLIGRIAAVKILHPELSGSRDIVNRFFNEAKATTTIKHPGIVEVFDFGYMPSGHAFLVMEFLEGQPLSQRMKSRGIVPEAEAALIMRGVCSALAAAHAKGIVHRDLKPDNIFVVPDADAPLGERTKILDFGIAKLTDVGLAGSATKTGAVMGTPTYMSPEQCSGRGNVDLRADLYSIGCMLYELVAGRPPFMNEGAGELIGSHLFVEPEPLSRHAQVTPEMERLVMSLLEKRPENRIQSAPELGQELVQIAQMHGWITANNTDPLGRFSMQHIVAPGMPARPALTPAHLTPSAATSVLPLTHTARAPSYSASTVLDPPKPTTLSGGAGESQISYPPSSKRGLVIGGVAVLAIALGIGVFIAMSGGGAGDGTGMGKQPEDDVVESAQPPRPAAVKPVDPKPADVKPVDVKPVDVKPADVKPVDVTSVVPDPADVKPTVKPTARPTVKPTTKPIVKPPTKLKPKAKDDLLETDL